MNSTKTHNIHTKDGVNLTSELQRVFVLTLVGKSLLRAIEHIFYILNTICLVVYKEIYYICNVFTIVIKIMIINENTRGLGKKFYTSNKKPVSEEDSYVARPKYFYDLTKASNQRHLDLSGLSAFGPTLIYNFVNI